MKKLITIAAIIILVAADTQTSASYWHGYPTAGITAMMNATMKNALNEEPRQYTQEEVELLARLITAEVGYSTAYDIDDYEEACYLSGSVVLNRMKSERFPNTFMEVITQDGQYECTWNGHINRDYDEIAFEIADGLLTDGTEADERIVYAAEFYQGSGTYKEVGRLKFCYE